MSTNPRLSFSHLPSLPSETARFLLIPCKSVLLTLESVSKKALNTVVLPQLTYQLNSVHRLPVYNLYLGLSLDVPFFRRPFLMPPKPSWASRLLQGLRVPDRGQPQHSPACHAMGPLSQDLLKEWVVSTQQTHEPLELVHTSHDLDLVKEATKGYEWTEILMAKLLIELKGPKMNKARLALKR